LLICQLFDLMLAEPDYVAATVPFVAHEEQFSVEKM